MIHIRASMDAKQFVSEREYHLGMKKANEVAGLTWHRDMLRDHFDKQKQKKYGYAPRKPKYIDWKKKKWSYRKPMRNGQYIEGSGETDNVLSGDMRDLLTKASIIRAFPTRATVTMTGPRYVVMKTFDGDQQRALKEKWTYGRQKKRFQQRYIGTQPDKTKEIQATTVAEREQLAKVQDKTLEQAAAGWHGA